MRIFLSVLAFILSLVIIKFALAFLMAAFGVSEVKGGGQLLINVFAYGLSLIVARAVYRRTPQAATKETTQYATKEDVKAHHNVTPSPRTKQPWLDSK